MGAGNGGIVVARVHPDTVKYIERKLGVKLIVIFLEFFLSGKWVVRSLKRTEGNAVAGSSCLRYHSLLQDFFLKLTGMGRSIPRQA